MSMDFYYRLYPTVCNNPDILPYLDIYTQFGSNCISERKLDNNFFTALKQFTKYNKMNGCYITNEIMAFINNDAVPDEIKDYVNTKVRYACDFNSETLEENYILIIWVR